MANNWFPHDSTAHNDQRILSLRMKYGWEGYGLYWAILESMYETADAKLDANALRPLCIRYATSEDFFMDFIAYCLEISLFTQEEGQIFSVRLVEEKAAALERSEMARKSAERRWNKGKRKPSDANALRTQSEGNAPRPATPPHPTPFNKASGEKNEKLRRPIAEIESSFYDVAVEQGWCDRPYIDKTLPQAAALTKEHRTEYERKIRVAFNSWHSTGEQTKKLAKKMFHEIAGHINDFGDMQRMHNTLSNTSPNSQ